MSVQGPDAPDEAAPKTVEIPLTRGYVTRIDEADRVFTDGHSWHAAVFPRRRAVYACAKINGRCTTLHSLLCPDWDEVDHIDGDGLNNCRSNLRDGAGFKNSANRELASNNTSGYKGVGWNKRKEKWRASIMINGKPVFLGYFGTSKEAADAYDEAAVHHFGEYAKTNAMLSKATTAGTGAWQHNPPDERTLRTHCSANHEYTPENTYIRPNGDRACRQCAKLAMRESRRRHPSPNPRATGRICPPGCTCGRHRRAK